MTVITCGRTHEDNRAEDITRALREQQGFCLDAGCGRLFDLDVPLQNIRVYRCLECARWLCKPCIVAHFEATNDAYRPSAPLREHPPIGAAGEIPGDARHARRSVMQGRGKARQATVLGQRPGSSCAGGRAATSTDAQQEAHVSGY